ERHPEFFVRSQCFRLRLTARRAVKSAQRIITVSEFSKAEIVHFLGVPEEKVKVIYNGVGPEFHPIVDPDAIQRQLERYGIRRPYLLVVGDICRRKNQRATVRGFARWFSRNRASEHQLVIVGKPEAGVKNLLVEAARLGLDSNRVVLVGYVDDGDLPCLYGGAELLLNTSLYEGFGLPVVEAMACGVPVIVSRASCFPEIAADAARFVDPQEPEEITDAIEEVLGKETFRGDLIRRGFERARSFRWDSAARETLKGYY